MEVKNKPVQPGRARTGCGEEQPSVAGAFPSDVPSLAVRPAPEADDSPWLHEGYEDAKLICEKEWDVCPL